METVELHRAIDQLPAQLQQAVARFVASLQHQSVEATLTTEASPETVRASRRAGLGELRGRIQLSDDFNDPLPEFAEY